QEPGTNDEIVEFCTTNYGVDFPMFSKIQVTGPDKHPLYAALTAAIPAAEGEDGTTFRDRLRGYGMTPTEEPEILWNFEKFLIARDGTVAGRFAPSTTPAARALVGAVAAELG